MRFFNPIILNSLFFISSISFAGIPLCYNNGESLSDNEYHSLLSGRAIQFNEGAITARGTVIEACSIKFFYYKNTSLSGKERAVKADGDYRDIFVIENPKICNKLYDIYTNSIGDIVIHSCFTDADKNNSELYLYKLKK
ncbi:hypothetical protein [Providencia burhodogranariea]|uniref:Uncharacterized protein n=1 Tax=Providencia burhodogranariea DSM 19968 TaxID=1141662 RepID=K8WR61_9GAMM|nr:hypothetical protein [Providencia burhodogranariea]EKT62436.1 hypothetical protein OOA_07610 [Providencia burhodogranariea DSM 19968]